MFYRSKKMNSILVILVMLVMISGGYILGSLVGKERLDKKLSEKREEPGYQTMQSAEQNNKEILGEDVQSLEVTNEDTLLVFEKNYTRCSHKRTEERSAEGYEVGLTIQDFGVKFPGWDIFEFSSEKVILSKEIQDYCPQHFILKDRDGMVVIYMPSEGGSEYDNIQETRIPTEKLPPDVQDEIRSGLVMDSLEEVEHIIENFDS